ncbi:MAG: ATP-binding protein [Paracoccaceae bacterium]
MAIKITRAVDPIEVKTLCITVYSQPGLGKTSLAFTASRPLLLDFDAGSHRAVDRKDAVLVADWSDVASIKAADVADYDTVIIDTAGKALDVLAQDIIRGNSKLAHGGALNQQGWGQLGVRFGSFLRLIRGFGKDVILLAHMDEQKDGDAIKERLKVPGGSKDLILTDSDVIARVSIHGKERHLMFSPTETAFGKDPADIVGMPVPDARDPAFATCMADVIALVKAKLNGQSAAQIAYKAEAGWFANVLPDVTDAAGINALLPRAKLAGKEVSKLVIARANALNLDFDAQERRFVEPEPAPTTEESPYDDQVAA